MEIEEGMWGCAVCQGLHSSSVKRCPMLKPIVQVSGVDKGELQRQFDALCLNNPTVAFVMNLYRTGQISKEGALMLAVVRLAKEIEGHLDFTERLLQKMPPELQRC